MAKGVGVKIRQISWTSTRLRHIGRKAKDTVNTLALSQIYSVLTGNARSPVSLYYNCPTPILECPDKVT